VPWIKAALTLVAADPQISCLAEQDIDGPVIEIEACDERRQGESLAPSGREPGDRRSPGLVGSGSLPRESAGELILI
jgi:hypothetical protein